MRRRFQIRHLFTRRKKYDFIFSLGEACFTAEYLKIYGQRKFSAPFDWVYGGTFENRIKIFIDEFRHYFDKADLEYIEEPTANGAKLYKNTRTGLMYVHDFYGKKDFDAEYKEISEKYRRRCERITDCLRGGGRVLCVYIEQVWKTADNKPDPRKFPDKSEIIKLTAALNKKYNNQIELIYFKINENIPTDETRPVFDSDSLKILEYAGALGGNAFPSDAAREEIIKKTITDFLYYAKGK